MGWLIFFRVMFIVSWVLALISTYFHDTSATILACFTALYMDHAADVQQAELDDQEAEE